jgi:hypothetical protein
VAASSTEAEYIATAFAAKETTWLRQLLREIEQHFIDPREKSELPLSNGFDKLTKTIGRVVAGTFSTTKC